jgi:5-methylcytosine-specific restriction endonuclease McrA
VVGFMGDPLPGPLGSDAPSAPNRVDRQSHGPSTARTAPSPLRLGAECPAVNQTPKAVPWKSGLGADRYPSPRAWRTLEGTMAVVVVSVWTKTDQRPRKGWSGFPTKFHSPTCGILSGIRKRADDEGKHLVEMSIAEAVHLGWEPCKLCHADFDEAAVARELVELRATKLMEDDLATLLHKWKSSPASRRKKPRSRRTSTRQHDRSEVVIAIAKKRAKSKCEMPDCGCQPFIDGAGSVFLEVHHIVPLSDGGRDCPNNTAALCPNCHRRLHHGQDKEERTALLQVKVKKKMANLEKQAS